MLDARNVQFECSSDVCSPGCRHCIEMEKSKLVSGLTRQTLMAVHLSVLMLPLSAPWWISSAQDAPSGLVPERYWQPCELVHY